MSRIVVILGATGKQGGSVVNTFLQDASFSVRAVARDPTSARAQALKDKGVEVVYGDLSDEMSLERAFQSADVIYAMTADIGVNFASIKSLAPNQTILEAAHDIELSQGKAIIRAASTALPTLSTFIFSALSATKRISHGKYQHVYHFDAKASAVEFLEREFPALAKKTAVLQLGMFATNWKMTTAIRPTKQPDGRYLIRATCSPTALHPFIDPNHDPAVFVKALASLSPSTTTSNCSSSTCSSADCTSSNCTSPPLRIFAGYGELITLSHWASLLTKHLGVEVYVEQVSIEQFAEASPTGVPGLGKELAEMWAYSGEFGYYGGNQGSARWIGELELEQQPVTMEEYVKGEDWTGLFE